MSRLALAGALGAATADPLDAATIRAALAEVMDPELPMISVVDLGMIGEVAVDDATGAIAVELLPTFVGCPALDVIRRAVTERVGAFGRPVEVTPTFRVSWTTDRISAAGLGALAAHGIAAPAAPEDVRCPYCASDRVVMDSNFGPTQCRSLHYCRECRQPFEAMKPV